MLPALEKIPLTNISSISAKRETMPFVDYPWHYHPEYEIVYMEKSYGIRFMGNHVGNFSDGDLLFIGPNLPHRWKNDKDFYQGNKDLLVDVYVIHFSDDSLTPGFFDLPELDHLKSLFGRAQRGLHIKGKDQATIAALVKKVVNAKGVERLLLFVETLNQMAKCEQYDLLSSPGYISSMNPQDSERVNKVMNYITDHFAAEVDIRKAACLANLSVPSFCRYFKNRTRKTFSQVVNEVRILNACKALLTNNETITQICYSHGYNNISHFNRQFKAITKLTAKEYKKRHTHHSAIYS